MTIVARGQCACGALRYRMTERAMFVHCCHCRDCQRQTGSAFVINALIEADRLVLDAGAIEAVAVPTDSGLPHVIHRCSTCKTAVWSTYGGLEALRFLRVGTLDDPTTSVPDVHIYTRSKLPWVRLPDDVPSFEAYYRRGEIWPPESLARRKALLG